MDPITEISFDDATYAAPAGQVKNAGKYKLDIDKSLVDGIGLIKLGLFPDDVTPKPVIRIVFTLASREAGIPFPEHVGELHHPDQFRIPSHCVRRMVRGTVDGRF